LGSVAKGVASVNTALLNSPKVVTGGKYDAFLQQANDIASGKKQGQGGLLGTIAGGGLSALGKVGQVLGTGARVVASTVKETSDLLEGDGFSLDDWQKQVRDKDFYASSLIGKTGNKWIDGVVGLGVDILTDPLTYMTFGASAAGRVGRVALATEAATLPIFANAPEKINAIARLGNLADLTTAERAALGEAGKLGMRTQFGKSSLIFKPETALGKASAKVATGVGRPLANVRAGIGDVLMTSKVRDIVAPKSYRILGDLGRRDAVTSGNILLARAAAHSANVRKTAEGQLFQSLESGAYRDLVKQIDESPYKDTLYQVRDGVRPAANAEEQALADALGKMQDDIRVRANAIGDEVNGRRGSRIEPIGQIDNYGVMHSGTDEARAFMNSSAAGQSKWSSELAQLTGLTKRELEQGQGIARFRKLVAGETFLGTKLQTGSIDEINAIFQREFKMDLFKTDASSLARDYIASASDHVGRVAFLDRLMDYSPEIVDKVLMKVVPNGTEKASLAAVNKVVKKLSSLREKISTSLDSLDAKGLKISDGTLARAEAALVQGTAAGDSIRATQRVLRREVKSARQALAEAEALVATRSGEVRQSFETILEPLRARVASLEAHVANVNAIEQTSMDVLAPIHAKMFPDVPVPQDVQAVAKAILDSKRGSTAEVISALEKRIAAGEQGLGRQLASAKGELTKLENKVVPALQDVTSAKAKTVIAGQPTVGGKPIIGPFIPKAQSYDAAVSELRVANASLAGVEDRLIRAVSAETKAILKDPMAARTKAINAFDASKAIMKDQKAWEANVKPSLMESIDELRAAKVVRDGGMTTEWLKRTDDVFAQISDPKLLSDAQRTAWSQVLTSRQSAEAQFAITEQYLGTAMGVKNLFENPPEGMFTKIVEDIKDGWVAIENTGLQMPKEIADLLYGKIERLNSVKSLKEFMGIANKFNQYFRVSAMLTPGFVVRNALTAAFNNIAYGATLLDTQEAIKFATILHRRGADAALASLNNVERELVERAYKGALASGAGQTEMIIQPLAGERGAGRLLNSKPVKIWSTANHDTEMAARMAMALRAAKNGKTVDQIAADVTRYHFNYSDLSQLDEFAKVFIPFWTFASKNIPLQIVNQITRPSVYRAYESLQRQMPPEEDMILPEWLARRNPLGLGAGSSGVLNPDLPQIDMADQLRQFADPLRLVSQMYPQYRLPIELLGDRKLSTGIPFSDKPQAVRGVTDLPSLLLSALTGQTVDTADGLAMTSKGAYVLPQAIPFLGTLQRLIPQLGGDPKALERQGSSIASALGLPYREVSDADQERALTGREIALQNFLKDLQRRGYTS
jgi:hypothetical protein